MADIVPIKTHGLYKRETKASAVRTLRESLVCKPKQVLVIFINQDDEFRISGYPNDPSEAVWLMEMAKATLLGLRK